MEKTKYIKFTGNQIQNRLSSARRTPADSWSITSSTLRLTGLPCSPAPRLSAPSSLLPAQEGWNTEVAAGPPLRYGGNRRLGRAGAAAGPAGARWVAPPSPLPHYPGNSAGDCGGPCAAEGVYDGCRLLPINRLGPELPRACASGCLRTLSPSTSKSTVSPSPTLRRYFLGFFFFMAVWWTDTSSLVSFLLMKPYPFLTLTHLTVPQTFAAMTLLSPLAGAADVRLPGLPARLPVVQALGSLALRAGVRGVAAGSRPRCSWLR
nr:uncharacterized protein LOC112911681 [Vulpes vulpes]